MKIFVNIWIRLYCSVGRLCIVEKLKLCSSGAALHFPKWSTQFTIENINIKLYLNVYTSVNYSHQRLFLFVLFITFILM